MLFRGGLSFKGYTHGWLALDQMTNDGYFLTQSERPPLWRGYLKVKLFALAPPLTIRVMAIWIKQIRSTELKRDVDKNMKLSFYFF